MLANQTAKIPNRGQQELVIGARSVTSKLKSFQPHLPMHESIVTCR